MRIFFCCLIIISTSFNRINMFDINRWCTFSDDECQFTFGRRWQIAQLEDDNEDLVLMAMGQNEEDERIGYTDNVISTWLTLAPECTRPAQLQFQFNIENENDRIEVFLTKRNRSNIHSLGQWNCCMNDTWHNESHWQQANVTFQENEEFQINFEIRHLAQHGNISASWFAIDDILLDHCSRIETSTSRTRKFPRWTKPWFIASDNWSVSNRSFVAFRWKFNNSDDASNDDFVIGPRLRFFTFLIYFLSSLIGLGLSTVVFGLIISIYRRYCLPLSSSPNAIIHYHYRSRPRRNPTRNEKTMMTTLQT